MANLLSSKSTIILSVVLLAQSTVFYGFSRKEQVPRIKPLAQFDVPAQTGWKNVQEQELDQATLEVLQADDILSRIYVNQSRAAAASLFIAYFQTQRTGKTPHSPKNCLPGAGWVPSQSGIIDIAVPGEAEPIHANSYVVSRGDNQSVVLYWYQSRNRTIASEYSAKLFTIADSIRYNRSDTALVRVVVGVPPGQTNAAIAVATDFVKSFFTPLKNFLPA